MKAKSRGRTCFQTASIDAGMTVDQVEAQWADELENFSQLRLQFLLY